LTSNVDACNTKEIPCMLILATLIHLLSSVWVVSNKPNQLSQSKYACTSEISCWILALETYVYPLLC